ncbi:MAG: DUF6966 domain-containing protein [Nitrospinales bacterium]
MNTLIQLLISCENLLRSVGEKFWADKINKVLNKGDETLDHYLLNEILTWYGGMGSFNDLIITEYNGHNLDGQDEEIVNAELISIRRAVYNELVRLIRD